MVGRRFRAQTRRRGRHAGIIIVQWIAGALPLSITVDLSRSQTPGCQKLAHVLVLEHIKAALLTAAHSIEARSACDCTYNHLVGLMSTALIKLTL